MTTGTDAVLLESDDSGSIYNENIDLSHGDVACIPKMHQHLRASIHFFITTPLKRDHVRSIHSVPADTNSWLCVNFFAIGAPAAAGSKYNCGPLLRLAVMFTVLEILKSKIENRN